MNNFRFTNDVYISILKSSVEAEDFETINEIIEDIKNNFSKFEYYNVMKIKKTLKQTKNKDIRLIADNFQSFFKDYLKQINIYTI